MPVQPIQRSPSTDARFTQKEPPTHCGDCLLLGRCHREAVTPILSEIRNRIVRRGLKKALRVDRRSLLYLCGFDLELFLKECSRFRNVTMNKPIHC